MYTKSLNLNPRINLIICLVLLIFITLVVFLSFNSSAQTSKLYNKPKILLPQNLAASLKYPIKIERGKLRPKIPFREIKIVRGNELVKVGEERNENGIIKIVGKKFKIVNSLNR